MKVNLGELRERLTEVISAVEDNKHVVVVKRGKAVVGLVRPYELVLLEFLAGSKTELEWRQMQIEAKEWVEAHPEGTVKDEGLEKGVGGEA